LDKIERRSEHVQHRRDAETQRIGARRAEAVHVRIDQPGQDGPAGRIDDSRAGGDFEFRPQREHAARGDQQRSILMHCLAVENAGIDNRGVRIGLGRLTQ